MREDDQEDHLPPMVWLRRIVVSGPTSFAEVRQDDCNAPNSQHKCALNKEHASRLKHAQPAPWDVPYIEELR